MMVMIIVTATRYILQLIIINVECEHGFSKLIIDLKGSGQIVTIIGSHFLVTERSQSLAVTEEQTMNWLSKHSGKFIWEFISKKCYIVEWRLQLKRFTNLQRNTHLLELCEGVEATLIFVIFFLRSSAYYFLKPVCFLQSCCTLVANKLAKDKCYIWDMINMIWICFKNVFEK